MWMVTEDSGSNNEAQSFSQGEVTYQARKGGKAMTVPAFTGERALQTTGHCYPTITLRSLAGVGLQPALGKDDLPSTKSCMAECLADCTGSTLACKSTCHKKCTGPSWAGGSGPTCDSNRRLTCAGIDVWEAGCELYLPDFVCGWIADEMRDDNLCDLC